MRSSSSSDPNAPLRATTPVFIDFFAKEEAEQQERTATVGQQGHFADLSPRHRPDATADAGPSARLPVTVNTIRSFLHSKGHSRVHRVYDDTVQVRLNDGNLSAATLLAALEIIHTPDHSLLKTLGVSQTERLRVTNKLKAIVNETRGFLPEIQSAAQRSNNDPDQLIRNFLQLVR